MILLPIAMILVIIFMAKSFSKTNELERKNKEIKDLKTQIAILEESVRR